MEEGSIIEGYAIETVEGLIFTVKGLLHPPNRIISYLRYLPDSNGNRIRNNNRYYKMYHFKDQEEILKSRHPYYLFNDPVFGATLQGVPHRRICIVYNPVNKLLSMGEKTQPDTLTEKAINFARILSQHAGVNQNSIGVSGSLLVDTYRPDSDLDIVIYGQEKSRAIYNALKRLLKTSGSGFCHHNLNGLKAVHTSHRTDTPLTFKCFAQHQTRKVNEGTYDGSPYFIRFVKCPSELHEKYGDLKFESAGRIAIQARVSDNKYDIYTPCHYAISEVKFLNGRSADHLTQVVSFRGRFADQVHPKERILAEGKLERVTTRNNQIYHRLIVGERPGDFLLNQDFL